MSRFADLVIKQDRSEEEDRELHILAQQLDYVAADLGTVIGPSGTVARLRAGSVVLDNAGMHTYLGGVETGRIEADGDFFLGTNIAAAATTSFAVFTNAQTYNSESIGAGDLLIGDNTASKANILWDKSAGTLLFRGGTTMQGYISTDGSAIFGGGNVSLSSRGIELLQGSAVSNSIIWTPAFGAGGGVAQIIAAASGSSPNRYGNLQIYSTPESGADDVGGEIYIRASHKSTSTTHLALISLLASTASEGSVNFQMVNMAGTENNYIGFGSSGVAFNANKHALADFRIASDNYTYIFDVDASADAAGFGTETARAIAAFSNAGVVFNEDSQDRDFRIETDDEENFFFIDGDGNWLRIGDWDTNYAQFAVDGELTLVGTARVESEFTVQAVNLDKGSQGPDAVIIGNTLGYSYDIGDDSVFSFEIPYDCDTSANITIEIYWYINEARDGDNQEVQWRIQWSACPADASEAIDGPTHTGTIDFGDQLIPTTAKFLTEISGTIAGASIADADYVSCTLDRVALDGGNDPTADPVIVQVEVEYVKNKLGKAT